MAYRLKVEPKHPDVDSSAYLLLDSIGERICATWHLVGLHDTDLPFDELVSRAAELSVSTFHEALQRVKPLRRLGVLRDDGTVDPVVMKRLRAKGATLVGIGDEPANGDGDGE